MTYLTNQSPDLLDSHDRYKLTKYLFQTAIDYTWKLNERGDEINVSNRFRYDRFSEEYTESNMFDLNGARQEGTRGYETEHHWDCDGAFSYKLHYRQTGTLELGYQYTATGTCRSRTLSGRMTSMLLSIIEGRRIANMLR